MAIKGLTDNGSSFPQIGKLRKGAKKVSDNAPGKDLNYFRFDSKDQKAIADFKSFYGTEPTEINVFLPYPTTDEVFFTCKEEWSKGGLKHRCDGETVNVLQLSNGKYQKHFAAPFPCPGNCKEVGRLKVIIPELRRFAYVTAETHSINDILNLHQQLQAVETTFGRLNSIPFVLRRTPVEISTPSGSNGVRARRENWLLSIEVSPQWAELQINATKVAAMAQARVYREFGADDSPRLLPSVESKYPKFNQQPVFGEDTTPITYHDSEVWQNFRAAIAQAQTPQRVQVLVDAAYDRVTQGILPAMARNGIDREMQTALERISASQLPVALEADFEEIDDDNF